MRILDHQEAGLFRSQTEQLRGQRFKGVLSLLLGCHLHDPVAANAIEPG